MRRCYKPEIKTLIAAAVNLRFENGHVILFLNFEWAKPMTDKENKATIHFAGSDFFIGVTPSGHAQAIETDSSRASAATPMELLLIALGSCTGVDVISILKKKRQQVSEYRIEVSGERREEFPRSFTRLNVKHIVIGHGVSEQAVAQAIELSDQKYCSVAATLRGSAEIVTSYEIVEED
jgi:putative redox protein